MVVKDLCFYFDEGQLFDPYDPVKEAHKMQNFNKTQVNFVTNERIKFMKTPKEFEEFTDIEKYFEETHFLHSYKILKTVYSPDTINDSHAERLSKAIDLIKKDAWNAAIKWCAENAEVTRDAEYEWNINEQSILNGLIE